MNLLQRQRAVDAARGLLAHHDRRSEVVQALLGDGAGNIAVSGRANWVYVRIEGDADSVDEAFNPSAVPLVEDLAVDLRRPSDLGLGYYIVMGISASVTYESTTIGDPDSGAAIGPHASQHVVGDAGTGGYDPLTVNARAFSSLRARAQSPAAMTLYVDPGWYLISTYSYWAGGNSPSFTSPPIGMARWDLLYLGDDDALHVLQGTGVYAAAPTKPTPPASSSPLCYVYMSEGMTSIDDSRLYDARVFVRASGGTGAGDVVGPGSSTADNFASFADASGKLLKDSGSKASDFAASGHNHAGVYAPAANGVTNGDSHDHSGGDGAAVPEAGLSLSNVTTGDVSVTKHGFVPIAPNDTSKFLRGDGTWNTPAGGGDVVGPAGATDEHLAVFDGATGKLLKDGGAVPAGGGDVVGPGSSVDGNLAVFDGTDGKLLKDGGAPGGGSGIYQQVLDYLADNGSAAVDTKLTDGDYVALIFFNKHNSQTWLSATNAIHTVTAGKTLYIIQTACSCDGKWDFNNRRVRLYNTSDSVEVVVPQHFQYDGIVYTNDSSPQLKSVAAGKTIKLQLWSIDGNYRTVGGFVICHEA